MATSRDFEKLWKRYQDEVQFAETRNTSSCEMKNILRAIWQFCSYLFVPQWGAEARGEKRSGRMADEGWLTETNQPFFVPLGVIAI